MYAGVLVMGGENAAGYTASGLLLTALCVLGQAIGAGLPALLQCYLALSAACCISTGRGLGKACQGMGHLLCRLLGWAGRLFGLLLGVQRVCTVQLDRSALKLGQLVAGSIPVVGQSLSDAGRDRSVRAEDAEKRSGVGSTGGIGSGVYTIVSSAFAAHRPAFRLPSALYHSTDLPLCGSVCLSGPRGPLHGRCDSCCFLGSLLLAQR